MLNDSAPVRVAYTADGNYLVPVTVSLFSLLENFSFAQPLEVYLVSGGISEDQKKQVQESLGKFADLPWKLHWISPNVSCLSSLRVEAHFNQTVYLRILLPELLPAAVGKILYLDCDTVIQADISPLFFTPTKGFALLAAQDLMGVFASPLNCLEGRYSAFGISGEDKYFNAGVLLLDLDLWRSQGLTKRVLEFAANNPDMLWLADQNAINIALHGMIGELDRRWNFQFTLKNIRKGLWPFPVLSNEGIQGDILHFISEEKPWIPNCEIPEKALFFSYWRQTKLPVPSWVNS